MKPMKLDIQMFATPLPVRPNINFKDITEDELPESLTFSFDGEQAIIQITGISEEYFWTSSNGGNTFNSITIETEGYSIIVLQVGDGTGTIYIDVYKNSAFTRKIIDDNVINQTTPDFSQSATTDEGIFTAEDNDGISAYFRGAVTNNYVKFANFWWRIIRVNGNGSVRLIYDGTTAHANGESSVDRRIGTSAFNTNPDDNAYVGYMYGTPGSSTYEATHANVKNSTIKTMLDNWYESNLSNYSDYIDTEAGFCGDRTPSTSSSSINNSGGTGTTQTYYAAYNRLYTNKTPSFKCTNNSDLYTTTESKDGNKALQYPIGLISADEVAYAGGVYNTGNSSYYLCIRGAYWTMSPTRFNSGNARVGNVNLTGSLNGGNDVTNTYGVRPVINLRGDLFVTGTGTSTDPYDVSLPVVPATIFNGTELTNIYYNGTEISKMYCNGVLVFEKGPTVYKRRIMVGDVFDSNSKIFSDIPDNFINEELPNMGVVDPKQDIITGNIFNVGELYIAGFYRVYIDYKNIPDDGSGYDEQFYVYDVYSYGTMLNNKEVPLDKLNTNDIIVSVNDNITYRHLYIEDPNIRPLQVGDKLVNKTKLYFVFPDDCYEKIKSSEYIVKINTITNEELGIITYWSASSQEINIGKITYDPNKVVNNGTTIYVWVDMLGQLYKNTSFNLVEDLSLDGLQFIGAVSEINSNSEIYNYILVDTTTLG